jgi:hypothetical protein
MEQDVQSIRMQIRETKSNINNDLIFLEDRLRNRVKEARNAVENTIEGVRAEALKLTPTYQVQKRPLLALGGAIATGAILGNWMGSKNERPTEIAPHRQTPSWTERFSKEIGAVRNLALLSALRWAKGKAEEAFPEYRHGIQQVANGMLERLQSSSRTNG